MSGRRKSRGRHRNYGGTHSCLPRCPPPLCSSSPRPPPPLPARAPRPLLLGKIGPGRAPLLRAPRRRLTKPRDSPRPVTPIPPSPSPSTNPDPSTAAQPSLPTYTLNGTRLLSQIDSTRPYAVPSRIPHPFPPSGQVALKPQESPHHRARSTTPHPKLNPVKSASGCVLGVAVYPVQLIGNLWTSASKYHSTGETRLVV